MTAPEPPVTKYELTVGAEVVWRTYGYSEMSVGETRFGTFGDLMRWMQ